jgi:sugar-specific transcriptional regulator TrmB
MPTDIFHLFTSLGLSETETKVYFASLNLGPVPVQDIAKKAGLSRTATYTTVEALQERGLMSTHERGKKKVFAAEEPERAISHFKEQLHEMQEKLETLNKVLPEIKMMGGGERPAVRFYEGQEALRALFNDVSVAEPRTFREVSNMEDVYNILEFKTLNDARVALDPVKIKIKLLHIGELKRKREGVTYRFVDKDKFRDFHGDIWIYGDRVAFVSFVGKLMGVVLENREFAETAKFLFDVAWEGSEKDR